MLHFRKVHQFVKSCLASSLMLQDQRLHITTQAEILEVETKAIV